MADSKSDNERTYLLITALLPGAASVWKRAVRASKLSAQWLERGPDLLDEDLRLLPSRKVAAFVEPAEMNQFGKRFLCPAPRGCIDLIGKDAHSYRNGDALGAKKASLFSQYRRAEETAVFVSQ